MWSLWLWLRTCRELEEAREMVEGAFEEDEAACGGVVDDEEEVRRESAGAKGPAPLLLLMLGSCGEAGREGGGAA